MNYEKAYKEAIERCKSWMRGEHPECFTEARKASEFIFPELKESEDERIRQSILELVKQSSHILNPMNQKSMIAWLKKQGEQHNVWHVEDEHNLKAALGYIEDEYLRRWLKDIIYAKFEKQGEKSDDKAESTEHSYTTANSEFFQWIYDRLKCVYNENPNVDYMLSLKERIEDMQKSTDWSEEDEKLYTSALWHIKNSCGNGGKDSGEFEVYNWLKSLKDKVQPKKELSEKDRERLLRIHQFIWANRKGDTDEIYQQEQDADWLMTLK